MRSAGRTRMSVPIRLAVIWRLSQATVTSGATLYLSMAGFFQLISSITFRLGIVGYELRCPNRKRE
jgi:hypothetical protein